MSEGNRTKTIDDLCDSWVDELIEGMLNKTLILSSFNPDEYKDLNVEDGNVMEK